jgi:invasion protein IalB
MMLSSSQTERRNPIVLRSVASVVAVAFALLSNAHASVKPKLRSDGGWPSGYSRDVRHGGPGENAQAYEQAQSSMTLPNGANVLKETYGDWGIECRVAEAAKTCVAGQMQYDQHDRVVFSISILQSDKGEYRILMILPFGLNLTNGIRLTLDEQAGEQRERFATCLPSGCLVAIDFSASGVATIKTARILKIRAIAFGSNQNTTFNVSLEGFTAAIERLKDLQ